MILRQFCLRHGRTCVGRSSRYQSATYATSISIDDRKLRPSTGDKTPTSHIVGHPDESSSLLDASPLPPTPRTRSINETLDSFEASIQAIQHDINSRVAARTGATIANLTALRSSESAEPRLSNEESPDDNYRDFDSRRRKIKKQGFTGSTLSSIYSPHHMWKEPPNPEKVTLPMLLAEQTHLGHHTSLWNPANSAYIYGIREGIHIISLDITYAYLMRAVKVIREVARRGGLILYIGTRKGHENIIVRAAKRASGYHIFDRWVPGTLTNGQQLLAKCGVKIVDMRDNELKSYSEMLEQGKHSVIKPDLVVCMNPQENEVCLHECGLNDVPTIGIIDTDVNPSWVTYPIPANDDSLRSVGLIAGVLSRAAEQGQELRLAAAEEGSTTYDTSAVQQWIERTEELVDLDVEETSAEDGDEAAAKGSKKNAQAA